MQHFPVENIKKTLLPQQFISAQAAFVKEFSAKYGIVMVEDGHWNGKLILNAFTVDDPRVVAPKLPAVYQGYPVLVLRTGPIIPY